MTNEQFLEGVQRNVDRIRAYKLGMDGRGGQCDCIGLIIGAIRLMGGVWNGTHGSNYAARNEMRNFGEIISENMLAVGDIVYKAKRPGQSGYDLPGAYDSHPDKNDYYHVGVVTKVNPLEITHCTSVSGGIKRDKSLGQWQYVGKLKKIQEGAEMGEERTYKVIGGSLRMRTGPDISYPVILMIPDGSTVKAAEIAENSGWMYCKYGGKSGYCMAKYLMEAFEPKDEPEDEPVEEEPIVTVELPLSVAKAFYNAVKKELLAVGVIDDE